MLESHIAIVFVVLFFPTQLLIADYSLGIQICLRGKAALTAQLIFFFFKLKPNGSKDVHF